MPVKTRRSVQSKRIVTSASKATRSTFKAAKDAVESIVTKVDDYVQCYVCSGPGHTAKHCKTLFTYRNKVENKSEIYKQALEELIDKRFKVGKAKRRELGKFY